MTYLAAEFFDLDCDKFGSRKKQKAITNRQLEHHESSFASIDQFDESVNDRDRKTEKSSIDSTDQSGSPFASDDDYFVQIIIIINAFVAYSGSFTFTSS